LQGWPARTRLLLRLRVRDGGGYRNRRIKS
jgi:hypothetical protein